MENTQRQTDFRRHLVRTWSRLNASFGGRPEIGNLAPTFFLFTAEAHLNSALLILNRLIDKRRDVLSIRALLKRAESCAALFPNAQPGTVRKAVQEDATGLDELEELINKIRKHRNQEFIHLSDMIVTSAFAVRPSDNSFPYSEIQRLLARVGVILNRYAGYVTDSELHMEVWGEQRDFDYLMDLLSRAIDVHGDELSA